MIDFGPRFEEAVRRIRTWRTRYTPQEYPHKVVINMMYRAYTMNYIWNEFKAGKLPRLSSFDEVFSWMDHHYSEIAAQYIQPNLLDWLESKPTEQIGTLVFANYDRLATYAENDRGKKEELEFSYIYSLLEDYCVLYFIGFRQMGKSTVDVISLMTNFVIEDLPNMDYCIAKQAFSQLYVSRFMNEHYSPLP